MSRNPATCPHNNTDVEDDEWFCYECGTVLGNQADYYEAYDEPEF